MHTTSNTCMDIIMLNTDHAFEKESGRAVVETSVERVTGLDSRQAEDSLAVEEPLEIQLAYGPADARAMRSISVTMRTPSYDFELAAGFLMTEGVVRDVNDIDEIVYAAENNAPIPGEIQDRNSALPYEPRKNVVRVELAPDVEVSLANLERNFYTASSCGICGKASLLALRIVCPARSANVFRVAANVLYSLPEKLRAVQNVFERTGGLHASGIFDSEGRLYATREDVGRHNAVDKLLGA